MGTESELPDDYGNSRTEAATVTLGSAVSGAIDTMADEDWFSINLEKDQTYLFAVTDKTDPSVTLDRAYLRIYDPQGRYETATSRDKSFVPEESGTFYLKVTDLNDLDTGSYGFSSTLVEDEGLPDDYGDSRTEATAVTLGSAVSGAIETMADEDWFSINLEKDQTYLFAVTDKTDPSVTLDRAYLRIYDPQGRYETATSRDKSFVPEESGTFYLKVTDLSDLDTGSYGFSSTLVEDEGLPDDYGDSRTEATAVTLGSAVSGAIETMADEDWFSINLEKDQTYLFAVTDKTDPSVTLDRAYLRIYDPQGRYETATSRDKSFVPEESGTFYLKVTDLNDLDTGSYGFSSTLVEDEGLPDDYGDSRTEATAVTLGSAVSGAIETMADEDWFSINLEKDQTYLFAVTDKTDPSVTLDRAYLRIYDPQGRYETATSRDKSFVPEESGTFYLKVTDLNDLDTGSYEFSLSVRELDQESESNDTINSADLLNFGSAIKGNLKSNFDTDVFAVSTLAAGNISVNFESPADDTYSKYFTVSLSDDSGNEISSKSSGKDIRFSSFVDEAGTYYISIETDERYIDQTYWLTAIFSEVAAENPNLETINGTENSETIFGTPRNDEFIYLGGNDILFASEGEDSLKIINVTDFEFEFNQIGNLSSLKSSNSSKFGDVTIRGLDLETIMWGETIIETENVSEISFEKDSLFFGTIYSDKISGTAEPDFIDGLGGADLIDGGAGIDHLIIFENSDQINLLEIDGIYRVSSNDEESDYYTEASKFYDIEHLLLLDRQIDLNSSYSTNVQFYDSKANSIVGSQVNDILDGGGGSDIIDGKLGHDTAIFFTSINDATVEVDHTNNSTKVSYKEVSQEEYAFSETTLYSIENIKFDDGEYDILTGDLFEASLSANQITEGGSGSTLALQLKSQPTEDVSVSLSSDGLNFDSAQMIFTSASWDQPQAANVNVPDNDTLDGDRDYSISLSLQSDDINFNLESPNKFSVKVLEDEKRELNNFIEGRLWEDRDKDGEIDPNESGLANHAVFIDANNNNIFDYYEVSVQTDEHGYYRFSDLSIGTYSVGMVSDFGWQYTFPSMTGSSAVATSLSATLENFEISNTSYFQDVSDSRYSLRPDLNNFYSELDGSGQTVVVIDTGIDTDHSYFGDRIIFSKTFGNGIANGEDLDGHGTHVAGIIASSDEQFSGVAPNANIIALKVFNTVGDNPLQEALQWCVANAEAYSIDAVNLSLGNPFVFFQTDESYWLDEYGLGDEFSALNNLGVVCFAAAGNYYGGVALPEYGYVDYYVNYGPEWFDFYVAPAGTHSVQGISSPAAYPDVISVGATWGGPDAHPQGSSNANIGLPNAGSITHFSQRDDQLLDVVAFGGGITSAAMGGGSTAMSGTSMAAPYVTGLVLLLQEAAEQELGRKLSVDEIRTIIRTNSNQNFDGDDENYLTQNPSNVSYNEASINIWIDQLASLKNPQFHSVDLSQTPSNHNFGLVSSKTNVFTNKSEQVLVVEAGTETFSAGGNDYLIGSFGNDTLYGGEGDDRIEAGAGADRIYGGEGDDTLTGGAGIDIFAYSKGDGNDTVEDYNPETETIEYSGYTNQEISQFSQRVAENGDTIITLSDGANIILTHNNSVSGNLIIEGTTKQGEILTADTSDLSDLDGLGSFSYQWHANGKEIFGSTALTYTLTQEEVGKVITVSVSYVDGRGVVESVKSSPTSAVTIISLEVDPAPNEFISGTAASDVLVAGEGNDLVLAKAGNDTIHLSSSDVFVGRLVALNNSTAERISLEGMTRFSSVIDGGEDVDTIYLTDGSNGDAFFLHDSYSGLHESLTAVDDGFGRKTVARVISIETINAGDGDDIIDLTSPTFDMTGVGVTLNGEEGKDTLWSAEGDDSLNGGAGEDVLFGSEGNDSLIGGTGADIFEFVSSETNQTDTIQDYTSEDKLKFYLKQDESVLTDSNIVNGDLVWGNVTIDFTGVAVDSIDDLNIVYDLI